MIGMDDGKYLPLLRVKNKAEKPSTRNTLMVIGKTWLGIAYVSKISEEGVIITADNLGTTPYCCDVSILMQLANSEKSNSEKKAFWITKLNYDVCNFDHDRVRVLLRLTPCPCMRNHDPNLVGNLKDPNSVREPDLHFFERNLTDRIVSAVYSVSRLTLHCLNCSCAYFLKISAILFCVWFLKFICLNSIFKFSN